jgi:predicted acetylornithine/succinylornithine family transaminase
MMKDTKIMDAAMSALTPNYGRQPIALVKGKGAYVWDADGKKYLDFFAGLAVNNLGHCPPNVSRAVKKQLDTLWHTSNIYYTGPQALYAKALLKKLYDGRLFFCNSGTEANEAALKLARRSSTDAHGAGRTDIIAFEGSFHGRTMGSLAMTGQKKYHEGFGDMLSGVTHVPFNELSATERAITEKTCAIIVEPIQGEIGVRIGTKEFIQGLAKLCAARNILLIFDEVQTGFGRTGRLFAWENYGVKPDIITMAKGIASGFPMGAMFAKEEVAKHLVPGTHAATFGGAPLACSSAIATLEELLKPGLLANVRKLGAYAMKRIGAMKKKSPMIKDVRGSGLMIGVELDTPCGQYVTELALRGLLVNCANERTIRLLPPLNINQAQMDTALKLLGEVLGV